MRRAVCAVVCVLMLAVSTSALRGLANRAEILSALEAQASTESLTEAMVQERMALHTEHMAAVEEENRLEMTMWEQHMEQDHDPSCVSTIFPVCRAHRDWCRQDCDNKHDSEQRCHADKCSTLFNQCHQSNFDRCDKGSALGVHPVWKDSARTSEKYCKVKIQEKCNAVEEVCHKKCSAPAQSCGKDKCVHIQKACQDLHKNSCNDAKWVTPTLPSYQENSKEFQISHKSESSHSGSSRSISHEGSHSEPKMKVQAKDFTSEAEKKVDGYIACEETIAKKCEAETKGCLRQCAAENADGHFGKCDPERCYRLHEKCSDKYSLECEKPKDKEVTAEVLKPNQHFCKVEDPACGSIRPDIVHKLNCTIENDFCLGVGKSHVSSCHECEKRKLDCYNSCRDRLITFSSNAPADKTRCTARRCMEEFNLCHELRCEPVKADLVEAEEVPEGSTAKARAVEQIKREREEEHFYKSERKKSLAAGVCGDGVRQPPEECDSGAGCDIKCLCGHGFKKQKQGSDCTPAGPAPCSFLKSGCLYGSGQEMPTIVPTGSLYNYDQGERVVVAAPS